MVSHSGTKCTGNGGDIPVEFTLQRVERIADIGLYLNYLANNI